MLQNFQQQPVKLDTNTQPPVHTIQTQAQNVTTGLGMVAPQPPLPSQPTQQKTTFDKVARRLCICICHQQLNILKINNVAVVRHCLNTPSTVLGVF